MKRARFNALIARASAVRPLWRVADSLLAKLHLGRYALLLLVHDLPLLRRLMPSQTWVTLDSMRYQIRPGEHELNGYFDVWLRRSYEREPGFEPQPGWFVVDLGANVGFFTLRGAKRGAHVFAVEPNPAAAGRLARNVRANGVEHRVHVTVCAVGRAEGQGTLGVDGSSINARVVPEHDVGLDTSAVAVSIRSLDDLLEGWLEVIDLMKIDTEGSELEILIGAPRSLERTRRVVLEYHSELLREMCTQHLERAGISHVGTWGTILYFARPAL